MSTRQPSWLRVGDGSAPVLPPELVAHVRADLLANIPQAKRPVLLEEDIQRAWRTIYWAAIKDFVARPQVVHVKPPPSSFLLGALMKWGRLPWSR